MEQARIGWFDRLVPRAEAWKVFVDMQKQKPVRIPQSIREAMQ